MTSLRLSDHEFLLLSRLVQAQTGIVLGSTKKALVEARLSSRLRELGLPSFLSYYRLLRSQEGGELEAQQLINRITTNITGFFRELPHFTFLAEKLLPAWLKRTGGPSPRLRLWSAGCATGQEPYSMAAVVKSVVGHRDLDARILATDVSSRALAQAQQGCYPVPREPLPAAWRGYFHRQHLRAGGGHVLSVSDALRKLVVFRPLNMLSSELPFHGCFDAIFCRNVLIYFDSETRQAVVQRLLQRLTPTGCLFLGLSEGLVQVPAGLTALGQSIYQRCASAAVEAGHDPK